MLTCFSKFIVLPWQNKAIDQLGMCTQSTSADYKARTKQRRNGRFISCLWEGEVRSQNVLAARLR